MYQNASSSHDDWKWIEVKKYFPDLRLEIESRGKLTSEHGISCTPEAETEHKGGWESKGNDQFSSGAAIISDIDSCGVRFTSVIYPFFYDS